MSTTTPPARIQPNRSNNAFSSDIGTSGGLTHTEPELPAAPCATHEVLEGRAALEDSGLTVQFTKAPAEAHAALGLVLDIQDVEQESAVPRDEDLVGVVAAPVEPRAPADPDAARDLDVLAPVFLVGALERQRETAAVLLQNAERSRRPDLYANQLKLAQDAPSEGEKDPL